MRRINPHVRPEFYFEKARRPRELEEKKLADEKAAKEAEKAKPKTIVPRRLTGVAALIAAIGTPEAQHLEYASGLLAYLPPTIREALGDAVGAQVAMLGCVLDAELTGREAQLRALRSLGQDEIARKAEVIAPQLRQLDRAYRLPLVALAVPALKGLDEAGRAAFLAMLRAAIEADRRFTLSEFVLTTILQWTIGPGARRAGGVKYKSRNETASETALVLSLLAHTGGGAGEGTRQRVRAAFDKGREALGMAGLELAAQDTLKLAQVSQAFGRLAALAPAEKERLLEGFGAAIAADEDIKLMEHELLRAVACVLDCPMPPAIAALDPRLLRK